MNYKETESFDTAHMDGVLIDGEHNKAQVVPDFQISINRAKVRTNMIEQFIHEMMKEGVDYGMIPGFPKPSLFKSGAEKLSDIFGFSKRVEVLNRVEDWKVGLFHYEVKVTLVNKRNGLIEAEGIGSCNTKERKFKYNDPYTIVNTVLKIAKKRAVVDAVLSATRSSGFFTQDIEDNENRDKEVTQKQLHLIYELASKKGLSSDEARSILGEKYEVLESKELSSKQASDFINYLKGIENHH